MIVSAIRFDTPIEDSLFAKLLDAAPPEKREKALRYMRREDRERTLIGEALVRFHLVSDYRMDSHEIRFDKNDFGKPLLREEGLHFNITHSGKWVACAIDYGRVGIDVEVVTDREYDIAHRFFSPVEYDSLMRKNEDERIGFFYDLWTLKESFIKAVGKGLSISLSSFSITVGDDNRISIDQTDHPGSWRFIQYPIDPEYRLSVCAEHPDFPESLSRPSVEDLVECARQF